MTFEDDLLALERRVLTDSGTAAFLRDVAALRKALASDSPSLDGMLARLAIPQPEQAAKAGIQEAFDAGGQRALDGAEAALHIGDNAVDDARMRLAPGHPKHLTDPLDGLDARLADAKLRATALLHSGSSDDVALAPIFQAATSARLRIETQINASSNEAALTVGDATSSPMVWEAERDACVYCLALAGEVVRTPGEAFPPADLYTPVPKSQWTVSRPPLHGHCRCRLAVLVDPSYADALKREAQRSILRGHALSSESHAVRIRAADRLLQRGSNAPKSVKAYAAQAVKRGHFLDRKVPVGDPRLEITRGGTTPPPEPPKPALFDPSGFKRIKPETGLAAAKKTNPLQSTNRAYQINCSHVVNAVELRQRGLDVVATPRPSLQGRFVHETAADWIAPDGQAPSITTVPNLYRGRDLDALEVSTANLPKGARGFVRVTWKAGGGHIFNWEKTGESGSPGLKFHEGQIEKITSVQARAYFKRVATGSVAWFRVDDAEPAVTVAATVEPAAAQAEEAERIKAAKKAEAERQAEERRLIVEAREASRKRFELLRTLEGMTRLEVMRRFGIDSPEFRAFTREEMRRQNPL